MISAAVRNKLFIPFLLLNCVVLALVMKMAFIFVVLAFLPSVVAYFVEQDTGRAAFKIVAICNLAATLPTLAPLLFASSKFEKIDILPVITDPKIWLFIYGGAAAGWILLFLCRFISSFLVVILLELKTKSLQRFQKKLLEEWGQQVEEEE